MFPAIHFQLQYAHKRPPKAQNINPKLPLPRRLPFCLLSRAPNETLDNVTLRNGPKECNPASNLTFSSCCVACINSFRGLVMKTKTKAVLLGASVGLATVSYAAYAGVAWCLYGTPTRAGRNNRDDLLDMFMPNYEVADRHRI